MRSIAPSEHEIQSCYFDWVRLKLRTDRRYRKIFAIPNGGKLPYRRTRNRKGQIITICPERTKLLKEGMLPGVWDILVAVRRGACSGLWIETKVPENTLSQEQLEWRELMIEEGFKLVVCKSCDDLIKQTEDYLR